MPTASERFCPRRTGGIFAAAGLMFAALVLSACVSDHTVLGNGTGDVPRVAPAAVSSVSGVYLAGRHAQASRDVSAATKFYRAAVVLDPENNDVRRRAVTLLAMEGRFAEAGALAKAAKSNGLPSRTLALIMAAQDLASGRYRTVRDQIASLPQAGLTVFLGPLLEALARIDEGKDEDVAAAFQSLKSNKSFDGLRALHLGILAYAAGRLDDAEVDLRRAIAIGGIDLRSVEILGDVLIAKGDHAAARSLYQLYLKEQPNSLIVSAMVRRLDQKPAYRPPAVDARISLAEVFFSTASSLQRKRQLEAAIIMARLALYVRPDYPVAQYLLGEMMEALGRPQEAAKEFGSIAQHSPYAWPARLRRADLLHRNDGVEAAIRELEIMAAERPDDPDPLLELGSVLRSKMRFDEAVTVYDRAIARMGPREDHPWNIYYSRGVALERSGKWPRAEKDFLYALEREPDQPFVLNYLGYSWAEKGLNIERARKMIEKAVELRPTDGYIVDSLGWVLYQTGDYQGAARYLEKAVELRPADPVINDHLGDAYWRVGRRLEAVFQWRRALSLDPEPDKAEPIKRKIKTGL